MLGQQAPVRELGQQITLQMLGQQAPVRELGQQVTLGMFGSRGQPPGRRTSVRMAVVTVL